MSSGRVHLIDDDAEVREALGLLLRTLGFTVEAHDSATGFLARLPMLEPGCIVTDLRMPAGAPASCMWYPEIEMELNLGIFLAQYAKTSPIMRIEGPGG